MTAPTLRYPDRTLVVPPVYAGSVGLYTVMSMYGAVAFDASVRWDKRRKESHRTLIGGANGTQMLTVPIVKPEHYHGTTVGDIQVSDHGHWWSLHFGALESAYGRTPYFEYYADELASAYTGNISSLYQLDLLLHRFACRVLGLKDVSDCEISNPEGIAAVGDKITEHPYWQVWSDRFGFQPGLSILDLIFSEGPYAIIHLHRNANFQPI